MHYLPLSPAFFAILVGLFLLLVALIQVHILRLGPGGIRELHWHQSAEWAYMTNGQCRITVLDKDGRACVQDVSEGDLCFFPAGQPHSLQEIGPHGCEFRIVFDDGKVSEFNTLLVTDWLAHTPDWLTHTPPGGSLATKPGVSDELLHCSRRRFLHPARLAGHLRGRALGRGLGDLHGAPFRDQHRRQQAAFT